MSKLKSGPQSVVGHSRTDFYFQSRPVVRMRTVRDEFDWLMSSALALKTVKIVHSVVPEHDFRCAVILPEAQPCCARCG